MKKAKRKTDITTEKYFNDETKRKFINLSRTIPITLFFFGENTNLAGSPPQMSN
jgi:hypothetical protein